MMVCHKSTFYDILKETFRKPVKCIIQLVAHSQNQPIRNISQSTKWNAKKAATWHPFLYAWVQNVFDIWWLFDLRFNWFGFMWLCDCCVEILFLIILKVKFTSLSFFSFLFSCRCDQFKFIWFYVWIWYRLWCFDFEMCLPCE